MNDTSTSMRPKTTTKRAQWLAVVAAIIRRENSVLMGQRPEGGSLSGLWEFPGGKIEMGEQPPMALARELQEELGIKAEIGPLRVATTHHYGEVGIILLFYEVNYWQGQPKSKHHTALQWVPADELKSLALPDANRNVLDKIIEILKYSAKDQKCQ